MRYHLERTRDSRGDSGGMSTIYWIEGDEVKCEHDARPRVGVCIRVGSLFARTMQYQDWWQTSPVTKILSDEPSKIVFETRSSEYVWKCD